MKFNRENHPVVAKLIDIFEICMMFVLFGLGMSMFFTMLAQDVSAAGTVTLEDGQEYVVPDIQPGTIYTDSHGATAYGWELTEGIRMMMLECGSYTVPEADKREHVAVLCKQLLYTQTVGGYNGWGTTLWGVMHASNSYIQTAPYIWTEAAEPTDQITAIFWDVWCNGYLSDFRVQLYRRDYWFDGDWSIPAYQIATTCYAINKWQDFSMFQLDENGVLGYSNAKKLNWFERWSEI